MDINQNIRDSFGNIRDKYDSARLRYPEQLAEDVLTISGLKPGGAILDIGCGSGISTLQFAKKGFSIVGLDINSKMLELAKKHSENLANVTYRQGSFEDTDFPMESFNLIISGQAFHWIDPKSGFQKASNILKEEGYIALFWNCQNYKGSEVLSHVPELYLKHRSEYVPGVGGIERHEADMRSSGLFKEIQTKSYLRKLSFSKKDYINLLESYSWISSLNDKSRHKFFQDLANLLKDQPDPFLVPYGTNLIIGKKI